jgi:heat shock protein beta
MAKKITRKVLEMLRKLADDEIEAEAAEAEPAEAEVDEAKKLSQQEKKNGYKTFWENFGKSIKLGLIDDRANKSKLSKLLRFQSSKSEGKPISLEKYVENMAEDQKYIYYITGPSIDAVTKSPFLERLTKKGYEVLFMTDPLDEYVVQTLTEFDGNQLQSVSKEGLKLGDEAKQDKYKEKFEPLTAWLKKVYDSKVEKVSISNRLAKSPCVLVTGQYGWSANMERIMRAQTFADASKQSYMMSKKTMEINPRHPIIIELATKSAENPDDPGLQDLANLMFDAALIQSGFSMESAEEFATRIHRVVGVGLDVDPNAEVEEEPEAEVPAESEGEQAESEDIVDDAEPKEDL